ncbi:MAG: GAF domain-containing protein [Roseiflexaceae bacterium]
MVEPATILPELPPQHTAVLQRVTRALALTTDSFAFLNGALDDLYAVLRLALVQVLLLNREQDELAVGAFAGPRPVNERLPLRASHALPALLGAQRTALVERTDAPALHAELGPLLGAEYGSLLLVPLVAQGRLLGVLLLASAPGAPFASVDVALAELAASALTAALYVGRLSDAMRRRNDQLAMVADIAAQVSSSLESREVYRLVVQKLNEYFHVAAGSLLLKDEATDELIFVMTLEDAVEKLHGKRMPSGAGIAGHVAQTQRIYISDNAQNDPLHYQRIDQQLSFKSETILCVPMVVKGNTIGVIELINKLEGTFTEEDGRRLQAAADIIGVAIENARLFEFVRQRRDRLEALLGSMNRGLSQERLIEVLSRELEAQDQLLVVKFSNPYIVGQPILKPEMCFGREPLFKRVLSVLHQNSLLLHGERRIGKTTVLRQIEVRLNAAADPEWRFRSVYIDLQGLEEPAFFHHIMEEVLHRFGKRAKGLTLRYAPSRLAYSGRDFQRDLRTVITALCGPQPDGQINRLVLLMDEADVMYGYDERVLQEFRRIFMNDYAAYLSVVFAAVEIQRQWKRYESPLYNLFQQIEIPPLTRADTELLVRKPVRGRYDYDQAAVDLIYQISGGRPMRVQHLCLEAINYLREQGRGNVTAEDIQYVNETLKGQDLWL